MGQSLNPKMIKKNKILKKDFDKLKILTKS